MKLDKNNSSQLKFQDIYRQEKAEIRKRREKQFDPEKNSDPGTNNLVGLALSGGGIRSATFSLGFLQELHRLKILRVFDYLSTVSGGGYVGGWWSAWLSREEVLIRAKEETPFFKPKDIRNAGSLAIRVRDGSDEVSSELKTKMRDTASGRETLRLIERNNEGETPDPKLVKGLVAELNSFISKPPRASAPTLNWPDSTLAKPGRRLSTVEPAQKDQQAGLNEKNLWTNRIHLEHTYPYELKNIFPPNEQIEPKRKYAKENGTGSEGSICAWEDPIHHLRLFANYLTPRKGMLSADTWRAVSVITRNLLLTWLILLPILTAVMLFGQAYFLFMDPRLFLYPYPGEHISITLALLPIGVLVAFTVAMAIAWLFCNRDTSSSTALFAQIVCFIALGAMIASTLSMSKDRLQQIASYQSELLGFVAFTVITILIMWHWKINRKDLAGKDRETILRWKREVRRGRFSRAQARVLVLTFIVAAVLLVSWLSCVLFSPGSPDPNSLAEGKPSFAWIPFLPAVLSAVVGSIFTALRTAPSAGMDKPVTHKTSAISRFIFATTPALVVLVLAVLAAWFAHWLLNGAHKMNAAIPLKAAVFLLITLGLALAIYEMKNVKWSGLLNPTLSSMTFIGFLTIFASWLWQALFTTAPEVAKATGLADLSGIRPEHRWLASAILAFCVVMVIRRAIPRGAWKWRVLYRHLKLVGININHTRKERPKVARLLLILLAPVVGIVIFASLTIIGKAIGEAIYFYLSKPQPDRIRGAFVLALAALAGGAILYRLLTTVRRSNQRYWFESRFFSEKRHKFSKRPEWLWTLASLSLILPLVALSLAHELNPNAYEAGWKREPILFPISLAFLLASVIALKSLVIQRSTNGPPLVGWAGKPFDWILTKAKVNGKREQAFRLLAILALTVSMVGDTVVTNQVAKGSIFLVGVRLEWLFLGVALVVNLPIFGVAVFKAQNGVSLPLTFSKTSFLYRKATLWALAFVCIALALLTGYLLANWLDQLSRIQLHVGRTPLLLPVAVGCLLMVFFEVRWGSRENRRSLWLIALAYLGIAGIFFMGLISAREAAGAPVWMTHEALNSVRVLVGLFAVVSVWIVSLGWMIDPNSVSMHQFYKGRLVRAYLGASNIRRRALGDKEITDTVAGDDLPLKSLSNCEKGGPYHLINTTLNLVAGRDLATAQRSASSFVLSQKYCGSGRTNYRPTDEYMKGQLSLGTAIAASGAAVSPNMGSKKPTAALAMLMTLLNVRLGYWAPTPNQDGWNSAQPRLWPFYLIREFLSQTNDLSSYCYLTDGGHFDNTGLYPLIERGCRFIVLVDCGADPQPACFQDLGEVIRRCRIDFGTEIDLHLDSLIVEPGKVADRCFVIGEIRYSQEHLSMLRENYDSAEGAAPGSTGTIVYFKPSVIGGVTADVRQYSLENDLFPQQTTANQWFDEAQFESYRRLGMACANKAFDNDGALKLGSKSQLTVQSIEALFGELKDTFQNQAKC